MLNKFKCRFKELSDIASRIIIYGMRISCLLMLVGLVLYLLNNHTQNSSMYVLLLSEYISEAAVSIAAIIIIGGLMFDYCFKKYKSEQ
ncbi:MAG: hypothetical protein GX800_12635 [Clostridiaceae bacterium]|nr:hypothetical protein [Clostridiaceae bacterium]